MALQLVVISILLSITLVSQPQTIDATNAFGPHPELLQHDPNAPSSKGNEFILGFMGNIASAYAETSTVALFVTTDDLGTVEFTVEYLGKIEIFEARKGRTTFVNFPVGKVGEIGDMRISKEKERNKGIHVKATDPSKLLTIYGINDAEVTTDAFLALPCHRYPVVDYKYFVFSSSTKVNTETLRSRFLIVACEDDTRVTIHPTQQIKMEPDLTGLPFRTFVGSDNSASFTINQLSTALFNAQDDLTGTIIKSNKPLSVFVGHECGHIPETFTTCDHLVEQIPPDATWGTQFFTVPLNIRESGERYRIGTVTDDNQVNVTCTTEGQTMPRLQITETIQSLRGQKQYVEFDTIGDNTNGVTPNYRRDFCCIETTKPAIVMMYSKGHSTDEITLPGFLGTQGDPSMLLVPPVSQYSNDYTVTTTAGQLGTAFAGHIGYALSSQYFDNSTVSRNALMINETVFVPDSGYHPIYCSNGEICGFGAYSGLRTGDHEVTYNISGAAMMLYVYGIQREISFGYPTGFEMQAIGVPRISIFNVTILESVGVVRIPINRTSGDISLRSVIRASSRDVSASAGQDYVALSDFRVRWLADQVDPRYITRPNVILDPVFQFTVIDDNVAENLIEYFEIDLKLNRRNGNGFFYPNAVGRVTIIDDDIPPQIGFNPKAYVIDEEAGTAILQIITNAPQRFFNASGALYYTTDGTATSSEDFNGITQATAQPIIFANGQPTTTVSINITGDHLAEDNEWFSVHIISGGGISDLNIFAPNATIEIADNDN